MEETKFGETLTKREKIYMIVEELAKKRKIEEVIHNMKRQYLQDDLKEELAQDLYLNLLEYKNEDLLINCYEEGKIDYFIIKIVANNLLSKSSRFIYKYIKPQHRLVHLDFYENIENNEEYNMNIFSDENEE